jgi:trimeric autotransporter adhesin
MAGVKVTLLNQGTGEPRTSLTNSSGQYDFALVVPATYELTAESASFKKFDRRDIIVGTQEFLTVDVPLEVGSVTESVLVTEQVPLVESSNASQGQVLDNQKLTDLPNLGRNPFMMSKLSANVIAVGQPAYNRMEDQSGSSEISIAGGPVRGNNYLLDGIPITDANNRAIIIPLIEAVQEVKIQANTYDAEMARTGGGMFNTLMKSGTNEYHGSAYGHLRRTDWDANSFFSNAAGIPITDQPNDTWGASFGGKVWIPKLYDGKNKTFFYLGVEHYDDSQSSSQEFNVPTELERMGDFSQSFLKSGGLVTLTDPLGAPFPNNKIPVSMLNPVGLALANSYALPASAPAYYGANDLTESSSIKARAVQYTAKIDEDFTSWWHASLSYLRYYSLEPGNTWFNSPSTTEGWRLLRRVDTTQLNNTFMLNPTTVLAVRYGFNRFPNYDFNSSQGYNIGALGFNPAFSNSISKALAEFPNVTMTSFYGLGDQGDNDFYSEASNNFSTSIDKNVGRHSLKAGFDYRRLKTSGSGITCPTGCYTFNTNTPGSNSYTGSDLGDLLLGLPYGRTADNATTLTDRINYYGAYIQDDFRLNNKLTLNYGLRWERESGISEKNNGLIVGFNGAATNPIAASVNGILPLGQVEYAGLNGNPTTTGSPYANKFGPRVGVAYQLNEKTVIRGGYGIFWAPQVALGGPLGTLGYAATTAYTGSTDAQGNLTPTLTNPFPTGLVQPTGNTLGTLAGLGQNFTLQSPTAKSPMIQQYSIDVQRQIPGGIALEVGYVGSHSTHLTLGAGTINVNALSPAYFAQGTASLNASVANPYYGHITTGTISSATVPAYDLLLPYSAFGTIGETYSDQNHARYDSMIIKAQKRFSHGLTFLSTFTWSKNYDETNNPAGNYLNSGSQGYPQNPYNVAAEYSLSNFSSPFRWATAVTYELPVGKGKPFLNSNTLVNYIVGGWSVNAVATYQTGFPLQIYQNNANSGYGYGAQRPNATGTAPGTSGSVESRLGDYINPAAFSIAPQGTFGDVSRTISLLGPGQKNWDLSVFKSFTFKERLKGQFRAEALNAFNSPLFLAPNTNVSSSTFGQITGQANFSRQLQLALRFSF